MTEVSRLEKLLSEASSEKAELEEIAANYQVVCVCQVVSLSLFHSQFSLSPMVVREVFRLCRNS